MDKYVRATVMTEYNESGRINGKLRGILSESGVRSQESGVGS